MATLSALRWQLQMTWSLLDLHLAELTDEDCLWEPSDNCWTVRKEPNGKWRADFAAVEPDPPPTLTIGWLTWHIGWWWSNAHTAATGGTPKGPEQVRWPGTAATAVGWLRQLKLDWVALLKEFDEKRLDERAPFPWQGEHDHTYEQMFAWANAELMKNTAEIGQLRMLRAQLQAPEGIATRA